MQLEDRKKIAQQLHDAANLIWNDIDLPMFSHEVELPTVNQCYELTEDYDIYPHFIAKKGMQGFITVANDQRIEMKLTMPLAGCEEWENCIIFTTDELEQFAAITKHIKEPKQFARVWGNWEAGSCSYEPQSDIAYQHQITTDEGYGEDDMEVVADMKLGESYTPNGSNQRIIRII